MAAQIRKRCYKKGVDLCHEKSRITGVGYEIAIDKAWESLAEAGLKKAESVKFLADEYTIDPQAKKVISFACNIPAKDFTSIIILHYLAQKIKGLPRLAGEWLPFRELAGIEGYFSAFRKRAIEPLIRKYGSSPEDKNFTVDAFEGVPVLIRVWRKDEEFGPDANIFFDHSVTQIFCTEDIVVLAGIIASQL